VRVLKEAPKRLIKQKCNHATVLALPLDCGQAATARSQEWLRYQHLTKKQGVPKYAPGIEFHFALNGRALRTN